MALIGMMGAGKTTVGRLLARRLDWRYFDSDEMVECRTGRTVPEILAQDGEPAFRAEETRSLVQALTAGPGVVLSVAGGAVLDPDNRRRLREGATVAWLRADLATLARRVGDGEGRPLLGGDPAGALTRLYHQRRPLYEALAEVVVDVDDLEPCAVVDRLVQALP